MNSSDLIELNGVEVGYLVVGTGLRSASIAKREGYLALKETFSLRDSQGKLHPFKENNFLGSNRWPDADIQRRNQYGSIFKGTLQNVKYSSNGQVTIEAFERLGVILQFFVEEGLSIDDQGDGLSSATTTEENGVGDNRIELDCDFEIPDGAYISFGGSLIPRYKVSNPEYDSGSTIRVILDRGLEKPVPVDTRIRVIVPTVKTPTEAIRDALQTAGLILFDQTWNALIAQETDADFTLDLFVRAEDKIVVQNYLAKIAELGNLTFRTLADGRISVFRGIRYSGTTAIPSKRLRTSEIIPPWDLETDNSRLIAGYSLIYKISESEAGILTAAAPTRDEIFKAKEFWKPIDAGTSSARDYKWIYSSLEAATFAGDSYLYDFSRPFHKFKSKLKGFPSGLPGVSFAFEVGEKYLADIPKSVGSSETEQVMITAFTESDKGKTYEMELTLLDDPFPLLAEIKSPQKIQVKRQIEKSGGAAFVVDAIKTDQVEIEIYEFDNLTLNQTVLVDRISGISVEGKTCDLIVLDLGLTNGNIYYLRMRQVQDLISGVWSKRYRFIPKAGKTVIPGSYGCKYVF